MKYNPEAKKAKYSLSDDGEFVIENYNNSKPFANFFPGIAGKYGIPMWTFYVNRGQAVCCFGIKDKDHSILEFFPANKAWQAVSNLGFRTFINISSGKKVAFYEPFHNGFVNLGFKITNRMRINPGSIILEEENLTLGLKVTVEYFNIPNDNYAGLARIVSVKNTKSAAKKIQILDGLPQIIPYGTNNFFLKEMNRTIEAWMDVSNLERGVPFYKLDVDPSDRPEVVHIEGGNFYLGFSYEGKGSKILKPIVEAQTIFGASSDFSCPLEFLNPKRFSYPSSQIIKSRTSCGFLLLDLELSGNKEKTFYSVVGTMRSIDILNTSVKKIIKPGYIASKKEENKNVILELVKDIDTESSSKEFDFYCKQTYLDNLLRGGYPLTFENGTIFYLYSRKHGDLERDYNRFSLQPTYFSQGNGNYRDLNQNRRSDIWFDPSIEAENLISLFNLIQTDGFNPLILKGTSFNLIDEASFAKYLEKNTSKENASKILTFLKKPFTPGEIILYIEDNLISLKECCDKFLNALLSCSLKIQEAEHGEGFWIDHWHYNLDLLDSYLSVYPEKENFIVFENREFTYFDNAETVKPRNEKYVLYNGLPKQLHSVVLDNAKRELIHKRTSSPHTVRSNFGLGEVYKTNLINKLLCLLANKYSSLDPFGVGIEMEANKPNWFDSLNGLPALFGSSSCETFELKRLCLIIKVLLEKSARNKIDVTEEINELLLGLDGLTKQYFNSNSENKDYIFWDESHNLKEEYRRKTQLGLSGKESESDVKQLLGILEGFLAKIDLGLNKAFDNKTKTYYGYFINEVKDYQAKPSNSIWPNKFTQIRVPLFLEAQMHALRLCKGLTQAKELYEGTRKSGLYDKKLKMYKVTESLASMPEEIGRCRIFSPGWLENESIWLHMEYKYILEVLRLGLYEEFYEDFRNCLIPFQKPERYGRNILENSSFLVSSAFADKNLHGNGYVARLSGSTAEFLSLWLLMNIGRDPFFLNDNNELNLRFNPALAGWLFDKNGIYSFNFLGTIKVNYYNPKRKDTFGKSAVRVKKICFNDESGRPVELTKNSIPSPYALLIRERKITKIDIYLD